MMDSFTTSRPAAEQLFRTDPLPEAINDSSCSAEMLCRSSSLRFLLRFMETRNITQTSEDESLICGFGLFQASEEPSRIRPE